MDSIGVSKVHKHCPLNLVVIILRSGPKLSNIAQDYNPISLSHTIHILIRPSHPVIIIVVPW